MTSEPLEIKLNDSITSVSRRAIDFLLLTKPRIVLMVLMTTSAGFYLGVWRNPDYFLLLHTLIGTALAAGGALALNQFFERDVDAQMERTRLRPLPDGRLQPAEAVIFGVAITLIGLLYLTVVVNRLSGLVTATIVMTYLFFYTPLKRKTPLCSFVGAIPGALPPVIGWTAVRGTFDTGAWVLFAIMFLWQIPHSLSIAWLYRSDYTRADFRLLPIVEPDGGSTGRQVVIHCLALLTVSLTPTLVGLAGSVYFFVTLVCGITLLVYGIGFAISRSETTAQRLFFASLVYLPVQFITMVLDRPGE